MTTPYQQDGRIIRLCRWAEKVETESGVKVVYSVVKPAKAGARNVDQSEWEWAEGAYIPHGYTAEEVLEMGAEQYKTLPSRADELQTELDALTNAIRKGLNM